MKRAKRTLQSVKSADDLVASLLALSERESICLLDSCGVNHHGSRFLIAGINPIETHEISEENPHQTLNFLDDKLSSYNLFSIFTISYEFGTKLEKIKLNVADNTDIVEPDIFLAIYDCIFVHDYETGETFLFGNEKRFDKIELKIKSFQNCKPLEIVQPDKKTPVHSNFSKSEYIAAIEKIKEHIRRGNTYQTNLTQQLRARLPENLTEQQIFWNLRKNHPAPFAAFLQRKDSTVISASPERFFKVQNHDFEDRNLQPKDRKLKISASPIKGTRPRHVNLEEDLKLRNELLQSEKDRAENVMIVDLLRNDLGRICKYGSVEVEKLCDLETHPTLFHLVSTINGDLRGNTKFSDIIRAVFPCGSITGAPKISTMRIINEIENAPRGLSMGAIGYSIKNSNFKLETSNSENQKPESKAFNFLSSIVNSTDLNVAIRTMVVREKTVVFNVGGGVVIDSISENEYEESLLKAKALLNSFGGKIIF